MAHREIRDDERCGMNTFVGVHVWQFETVTSNTTDGDGARRAEVLVSAVECRDCHIEPRPAQRGQLIADYERTVNAERLSKHLRADHKEATGLGKRRA